MDSLKRKEQCPPENRFWKNPRGGSEKGGFVLKEKGSNGGYESSPKKRVA